MMRSFGAGGGLTPNNLGTVRVLKYFNKSIRSGGVSVSESQDSNCPFPSLSKGDGKNDILTTNSPSEHVWPPYLGYPVDNNDGGDWVYVVPDMDDKKNLGLFDGHVFGSVPSSAEVSEAVSSLQRVLGRASSDHGVKDESVYDYVKDDSIWDGVKDESVWDAGEKNESVGDDDVKSESVCELEEGISRTNSSSGTIIGSSVDWTEPSLQIYNSNSKMLQRRRGYDGVYDAIYMLQNEPAVQKMVASLASDNAVWDAVLNNDVVRGIRDSLSQAAGNSAKPSKASSESGHFFMSFIANVKAKITGLIDSLRMVVNGLASKQAKDEAAEMSGGEAAIVKQVKVSFTLAMMVFLLVVLKRIETA